MSYKDAVSPAILEFIKSLQDKEYLSGFYLVGGTALALHYNHRISVDIDLFSNFYFDAGQMLERIQHDYNYNLFSTAKHTLKGNINGINVDILAHRYPYLQEPQKIQGIMVLSVPDIIAMKLNAISISGERAKDFIDIYFCLKNYPIAEMIHFYKTKYQQESAAHVIKSLIYFEDVDLAEWPVIIKNPELEWSGIKERIENRVLQFINKRSGI